MRKFRNNTHKIITKTQKNNCKYFENYKINWKNNRKNQ